VSPTLLAPGSTDALVALPDPQRGCFDVSHLTAGGRVTLEEALRGVE
jgi:hypothetical protein